VEEHYAKNKQHEDQIRKSSYKMEAMRVELDYAVSAWEQSDAWISHLEEKLKASNYKVQTLKRSFIPHIRSWKFKQP
jgi:exonuclease VII small subunit